MNYLITRQKYPYFEIITKTEKLSTFPVVSIELRPYYYPVFEYTLFIRLENGNIKQVKHRCEFDENNF